MQVQHYDKFLYLPNKYYVTVTPRALPPKAAVWGPGAAAGPGRDGRIPGAVYFKDSLTVSLFPQKT
ncbi:hypothetical protein GCM10023143_02410 [Compostibacter hankyongensis]|uniref:Uncharacterized protein n=1 Tax=Compostibacter hankyongensis TaxID=1007089 RepID=A0ABP8FD93_9BACT